MPFYRMNGSWVHLKMSGKAPAPCCARTPSPEGEKPEVRCAAISTVLCDWPVDGGTCDTPLCPEHAAEVAENRHYCPRHLAEHRAAQPELF